MAAVGTSKQTMSGPDSWIITTSLDKPDRQTRRFIRSHVMRGKNTREHKRFKKLSSGAGMPHGEASASNRRYIKWAADATEDEQVACAVSSPRIVATELTCSIVAARVKPSEVAFLHKAIEALKPSRLSLERAVIAGKSDDFFGFPRLCESPALVQCMLFMAQVFEDTCGNIPFSKSSQVHLTKTLSLLQKSLSDEENARADATVAVVSTLASVAMLLGDLDTADKHVEGMAQIINLRGGLDSLDKGRLVDEKAQRIDFGIAVSTGRRMKFLREDVCWSPEFARSRHQLAAPELGMIQPRPDPRLLNTWVDIRAFSQGANEAIATGIKLPVATYTRFTASGPSRLMNLEFDLASPHELLRVTMLAYLKGLLCQIKGFGRHLKYLADRLETTLRAQQMCGDPELDRFLLWASYIAAIAVFEDGERKWLQEILVEKSRSLGLRSWLETKRVLRSFLWIDTSLDGGGQALFDLWVGSGIESSESDGRTPSTA